MTSVDLIEQADDAAIAAFLEGILKARLREEQRPIAICLPGGSTPFPILQRLAETMSDWRGIEVWPGDDRIVPEDHEASNTGKLRTLLEPLGANVVALEEGATLPHFALVWLGMGADGHIASLFPNTDPQVDDAATVRRLTPDPLPPEAPFDRLTLTIPALLDTDQLMFVIRGDDKREVFEGAQAGAHDLPVARLLSAARQPVTCFA
ncbi:6-phosphogluconolactonase [Aurantiacibacter suaedae]|uniref:6-phosphogluconolactonase n=1 Tax=Aurantiacibacter suaedae TaxID=2545755 RepID=UPI0010F9DE46|nr:6-phosphogluconolactonase [Aurantiacibacter suaedae]